MSASSFGEALRRLLQDEGGNDDDPHDPGGRTSRGVTQGDWDKWVRLHPERNLPADVWRAPQAEVDALFKARYWDKVNADSLPPGVDYTVFDYAVHSGIGRAPKVLQHFLGVAADGEVGPDTVAAAKRANAPSLINMICDERLAYLKGLENWARYGKGWGSRVERVRSASLQMAKTQPASAPAPAPSNPLAALFRALVELLARLFRRAQPEAPPAPAPEAPKGEPKWLTEAKKDIGFHERGENQGIEHFIDEGHTGHLGDPWCAIFVNAKLEECGVPGTRSAMARSFEKHKNFVKLDGPALGAIATFWRGSPSVGSGHVSFYAGTDPQGRHVAVGGNQSDSVCAAFMDMARHVGWYWPRSQPLPKTGAVRIVGLRSVNSGKET